MAAYGTLENISAKNKNIRPKDKLIFWDKKNWPLYPFFNGILIFG